MTHDTLGIPMCDGAQCRSYWYCEDWSSGDVCKVGVIDLIATMRKLRAANQSLATHVDRLSACEGVLSEVARLVERY